MARRMRRLSRILLNAAAVVSLGLCVLMISLWVRSYTRFDHYHWWDQESGRYVVVASLRGGLQIAAVDRMPLAAEGTRWFKGWQVSRLNTHNGAGGDYGDDWQLFRSTGREPAQRLGFKLLTGKFDTGNFWSVRVPFWCPALASAILPGIVFVRFMRRVRRWRAGLCPTCGYDLRATPSRCPECGAAPAA